MNLTELTQQLSESFDKTLDSILSDPQQQSKEDGAQILDTHINTLKSTFVDIESRLKEIRLQALQNKELSVQETNKLLKRDIQIKTDTIKKYVNKLQTWESEIPALVTNSQKAMALRTDGTDFDSDIVVPAPPIIEDDEIVADEVAEEPIVEVQQQQDEDEDDDDDVEFEEV